MKQATMLVVVSLFFLLPALGSQVRGPTMRIKVPQSASAAVFQASVLSMKVLKAKMDLGQATAIDYAVAAANLRTMFAHMDETGITASVEQYILANPTRFTDFPSEPELQEAVSKVPEDQRVAFVAYIQAHGLKAFHQILLSTLEQKVTAMMLREGRFLAVQYPTQGQRQQKMNQDPSCNASFFTGWATLYGSIVGFVVGGPVGEGIFWAGLAASYYAFVIGGC